MNYKSIFIKKELLTILGVKKRNLYICSALLFVAVFTISLSLGAYKQLKVRMDNPFTNWVTMPVLYQYRENIPLLKEYFSKTENLSKYGLKDISGYVKWTFKIVHPTKNKVLDITGRTLDFTDDITKKIFEPSNILYLKDNFSVEDSENLFELFVSEDFCKNLQIEPKNAVGKNIIVKDFEANFVLLFKIGGIVKNLPNHSKFIMSQDFFNMFKEKYETTGFVEIENQTKLSFMHSENISDKVINERFNTLEIIDIDTEQLPLAGSPDKIKTTMYTNNFVTDSMQQMFYNQMLSKSDTIDMLKEWKPVSGYSELSDPMYFSFNFMNLEKIRDLQEFLKREYKMEIELSVVEDRDNFSMVSKLTFFMIISLVLVSLISFTIFLYNLIKNHLDKIKPNIGTFMAFGFAGSVIAEIYTTTILRFMMYAWSIVTFFIVCFWVLGFFTGLYTLDLFHPIVIFTFLLFNLLAYFLTKYITGKILGESPGDLIYGRV